jgi:hypothetical protein
MSVAPLPTLPAAAWNPVARFIDAAAAAAKTAAAAAAAALADAQKLQHIKDLLKKSATGAAAVKYLEDKGVKVEFANGGGSFWDGTKTVIDRTGTDENAALTVVHEINHAKATLEGTGADINTDTRAGYVDKMLKEEVQGTIDSIKTKNELVAGGNAITATFPLEKEYNDAYKKAVDDAKAADPKATDAALKTAGEKAGSDAVMKGFKDGSVVTSNTHEKYPDYYGKSWDGVHPTPPAPPTP